MKWIVICLLILPASSFSQTLTPEEVKFAAAYIKFLEKKDSINSEIIKNYELKSELELTARVSYENIIKLQDKQLEMYSQIRDDIHKISCKENKFNITHNLISFLVGFIIGKK